MKAITKFLLVGAVAVMAVAISTASSEAAKRKAKGPAPGKYWGEVCTAKDKTTMVWGYGNKWHPAFGQWCKHGGPCAPACG
jgi:hypothetical protein